MPTLEDWLEPLRRTPKPWKPGEYCDRCQNTGTVDCHCGGDLCVCENYGEKECPCCHGECCDSQFGYDE